MHIPDNYLSPSTCAVLGTAMVPVWAVSVKAVKAQISSKENIPLLGIGAAFSFLGMMFNIPLPGGTTGHAVGGNAYRCALRPVRGMYFRDDRAARTGAVVWGRRDSPRLARTALTWHLSCRL